MTDPFRKTLELPYNRMGWAFEERPDLDPSATLVLLTLAFKARNGGMSTVAVETICRLTRLGRATVQRALKRLVLAGLIADAGRSPGRWTNKYRLALAPYSLKMPTPGEPGPTPKRFPRTGQRAEVRTIEPERSLPVQRASSEPVEPVEPYRSETVQPSRSETRETRRVIGTKNNGSRPSIQTDQNEERIGSASATPARVNGASAPSAPSNGNSINGEGKEFKSPEWGDRSDERSYEQEVAEAEDIRPMSTNGHERPISPATIDLNDYLENGVGRPLDGPWCRYADLERDLERRDFREVGDVLAGILSRTGGALPEPEKFFGAYGEYREAHLARQRARKDGRRRAA